MLRTTVVHCTALHWFGLKGINYWQETMDVRFVWPLVDVAGCRWKGRPLEEEAHAESCR